MASCHYYEKRIITDISGNVYPIWEIYDIDKKTLRERQITVLFDEESLNVQKGFAKLIYRKYTDRGLEADE